MNKNVYITGMFDMHNYGDLLFPLIAQYRLSSDKYSIIPVAPTSIKPRFVDVLSPISVDDFLVSPLDIAGVLIGGGYIIHTKNLELPGEFHEYAGKSVAKTAAADLWIGVSKLAKNMGIPILWNAPGAPFFIHSSQSQLIQNTLQAAKYLNVRDEGSAIILNKISGLKPKIIPDTALDISRMWPKSSLIEAFKNLLLRKNIQGNNFVHIHVRNRSLGGIPYCELAKKIEDLAIKYKLIPILNGLGESHNDHIEAKLISNNLTIKHLLLDDPISLHEITASIAFSQLYMGASMHGYISASSYGVPGVLIAKPAYKKFSGIVSHLGRKGDLVENWNQAFFLSDKYLTCTEKITIPQKVYDSLDGHWENVARLLS